MRLAAVALLCALVAGFGKRLGGQAADELILWAPQLAEALIRAGARLFIPGSHRQRYTDEWLAHLDDFRRERDTPLATIGCAIGIVLKGATGTVAPRTPGSDQPAPGHEAHRRRTSLRQTSTKPAVFEWVVGVGVVADSGGPGVERASGPPAPCRGGVRVSPVGRSGSRWGRWWPGRGRRRP